MDWIRVQTQALVWLKQPWGRRSRSLARVEGGEANRKQESLSPQNPGSGSLCYESLVLICEEGE